MNRSIRRFLLFNLLLSITITSSITAVGTYLLDNQAIQRHLDVQLQQVSDFLNAVIAERSNSYSLRTIQEIINQKTKSTQIKNQKTDGNKPSSQFRFQVWDQNNRLILHSLVSPQQRLTNIRDGFANVTLKDETWRVYASHDSNLNYTFLVAEPFNFRTQLEKEITWDNLLILIWIYPFLGLLIWITVGGSLTSLKKTAHKLSNRPATDFSPIDLENAPIEVKPLINELNQLFTRLQEEFERNKRFASDAAHELRTPLAALKTQAQVAILSNTDAERQAVIKKLLLGVDRCTHIVHQLLTLSRLGQQTTLDDIKQVNLASVTVEMIAQLAPLALEKNIDIELKQPKYPVMVYGNETMLSILIRNLVDNAIRYTPKNGSIVVEVMKNDQDITLRVTDSGPGIPLELQARVFERFYRILGSQAAGSGLGLAIVQQISELHNAQIQLGKPEDKQGLVFDIIFPLAPS